MTRAEFAAITRNYWKKFAEMKDEETFADFTVRRATWFTDIAHAKAVADVATNGFDPEPIAGPTVVLTGPAANAYAQNMLERAQEAAKRSRPFVGSHKLPVDLDWD